MVSNAKETNSRQSEVFSDSERVRKAVSNLMVKYNPAYKSGNYQAVATPLPPSPGPDDAEDEEGDDDAPGEEEDDDDEVDSTPTKANGKAGAEAEEEEDADGDEEEDDDNEEDEEDEDGDDEPEPTPISGKRRRGGRPSRSAATPQASRSASTQGKGVDAYDGISFEGLTFQQAQEKIVGDVLRKKDDKYGPLPFKPYTC